MAKLSDIGKRFAEARAAGGVADPGMGATPAQTILAGQHDPALAAEGRFIHVGKPPFGSPGEPAEAGQSDTAPLTFTRNPPPLPEPADEAELDTLRYHLRAAIHELNSDLTRLNALHDALRRAVAEWAGADDGVGEAEVTLREVKVYSKSNLVTAYLDGQPTAAVMTEADAQAHLDIHIGHRRHAQEITDALRAEIASIEHGLADRRRDCKQAAGRLLSRSAPLIALVQRIYDAYATLRDHRLILNEIGKLAWLDDDLRQLAENDWPSDGYRRGGYRNDEALIASWTDAVADLLRNGDASLPGPGTPSGPSWDSNPRRKGDASLPGPGTPSGPSSSGPEADGLEADGPEPATDPAAPGRDQHGRFRKAASGGTDVGSQRGTSTPRGERRVGSGRLSRRGLPAKPKRPAKAKVTAAQKRAPQRQQQRRMRRQPSISADRHQPQRDAPMPPIRRPTGSQARASEKSGEDDTSPLE